MKTTFFKTAAMMLLAAGSFWLFSCEKPNTTNDDPLQYLEGTRWKLVGIMDTETGVLTELEPKECEKCYTLTFDTDSTFSTYSSFEHTGLYKIDYTTFNIDIIAFGGPEFPEMSQDGEVYCDVFVSVQSFFLKENELRLYYNNKRNYLQFKSQVL